MTQSQPPKRAVAVVLTRGDKVLAVTRDRYVRYYLPGGVVAKGETLPRAARRALHEETDLVVSKLTAIHTGTVDDGTTEVTTFTAPFLGDPKWGTWVNWYELLRGPWGEVSKEVRDLVVTPEIRVRDALACYLSVFKGDREFARDYCISELTARYAENRTPLLWVRPESFREDLHTRQRRLFLRKAECVSDVRDATFYISRYVLWYYLQLRDPKITWEEVKRVAWRLDDSESPQTVRYVRSLPQDALWAPRKQVMKWAGEIHTDEYRPYVPPTAAEREAERRLDRRLFGEGPPRTAEEIAIDAAYEANRRMY